MAEIQKKLENYEKPLWDFISQNISESILQNKDEEKKDIWGAIKKAQADSTDCSIISFPYVSQVPQEMVGAIPKSLEREWQQTRATQEVHKIHLLENLLSDWSAQRRERRERSKRIKEAMARENTEFNYLFREINKVRLHMGKELRYLAQDAACLGSAIKSIHYMRKQRAQTGHYPL